MAVGDERRAQEGDVEWIWKKRNVDWRSTVSSPSCQIDNKVEYAQSFNACQTKIERYFPSVFKRLTRKFLDLFPTL